MLSVNINELKSKKYMAFIDYAFANCDCVSFVIDIENQLQSDFLKALKLTCANDFLSERFISFHPETGTDFDGSCMVSLKCNEYIKKVFFDASCIKDFNGVDFPEELCFFRGEIIWFKLISHEQLSFILNETNQDINFLESVDISYTI